MQQEANSTDISENDTKNATDENDVEQKEPVEILGKEPQSSGADLTEGVQKSCGEDEQCVEETEEDLLSASR